MFQVSIVPLAQELAQTMQLPIFEPLVRFMHIIKEQLELVTHKKTSCALLVTRIEAVLGLILEHSQVFEPTLHKSVVSGVATDLCEALIHVADFLRLQRGLAYYFSKFITAWNGPERLELAEAIVKGVAMSYDLYLLTRFRMQELEDA